MSIRTTILDETTKIHKFISKMATNVHVISEYLEHQKPKKEEKKEQEPSWKNRSLHGMYHDRYKMTDGR